MQPNVLEIPTWLSAEEAQSQMPAEAWALLSDTSSLTARLRQLAQNNFSFRLLFANWGHANPIERHALNLAPEERTWIRCIEHRYRDCVWVSGRAIFPEKTVQATQEKISGLGIQSLGDVIFKDPSLKRDPFSFCLLTEDNVDYPAPNLWARRSIMYYQQNPILITEVFRPESYAPRNV